MAMEPFGIDTLPVDPDDLRWQEADVALVALLADDLMRYGAARPRLLAFAGEDPIAAIVLRPFAPGETAQALIEVLALVVPLGADRLAFGGAGRLWSLDDPIVPVCDTGDLRQRGLAVTMADGRAADDRRLRALIVPVDGGGDDLRLLPPVTHPEPPIGPMAEVIGAAVAWRDDLVAQAAADPSEIARQLGRVLILGHEVLLAPEPASRLAHDAMDGSGLLRDG